MVAEEMERVGPPTGEQHPVGEPASARESEENDRLFRRPAEGTPQPQTERPPVLKPQARALAAPERHAGGLGQLMMAGLLVLGIIGGGIVGSLTTLALTGRTPTAVQSGTTQRPVALVDSAQTTAARPGESSIATIARQVVPAVVTIRTREGTTPRNQSEGEGSGFIVDNMGHILTNNHVVADANRITVIMADGTRATATVAGRDPSTDLAVLKADLPAGKFAIAVLGDSDTVQTGDTAIAIGAPFGLDHSVTAGIISAVNRDWGRASVRLRGLLQTDAPVNPGNSGGPLLNAAGEVIGINNAIEGPIRGSVGVGFAIPINLAKRLLPQLSTGKTIEHPWLGISGVAVSPDLAQDLSLSVKEGVLVFEVIPDSPAAKAGVKGGQAAAQGEVPTGGDIVTKVDGKTVKTVQEIAGYLDTKRVGDKVTLTILRDGKVQEFTVTLGVWPENLRS